MWLLRDDKARELARAREAGLEPTQAQHELFEQSDPEPIDERAGSTAVIKIEGVLTPKPDLFAQVFGGGNTSYEEIQAALTRAAQDTNVSDIRLEIGSPGGTVEGLFETLAVMQEIEKPINAVASQATSAAYAIGAMADKLEAVTPAAEFGSVGVVVSMLATDEIVTLTNSDSPQKRPDPRSEEGRKTIVEYLDAINDLLVDAIASGRNTTKQEVLENYGKGAIVLARAAQGRGMIDSIQQVGLRIVRDNDGTETAASGKMGGERVMDLETLKAQHPAVFQAAVAQGVQQERDRVAAHLTMGEKAGAMDVAVKAIREGHDMTQSLTAEYVSAGLSKRDIDNRTTDDKAVADAVDNAHVEGTPNLGEQVVSKLEEQLGLSAQAAEAK